MKFCFAWSAESSEDAVSGNRTSAVSRSMLKAGPPPLAPKPLKRLTVMSEVPADG